MNAKDEINQAWSDFLWDPTSRCIICLTDEAEVKYWRDHPKHGRVFVCQGCAPVRNSREVRT